MTSWFDDARFGMFVHWSHCSQRGLEVSWPLVGGMFALPAEDALSVDGYHALARTFDPRAWDARALARRAREAGMRYAVITAKHHDGFAMYHTRQSDYGIANTPFGRDVVREFLDALRAEGLHTGVYFSLIDWHHPDYPPFRDEHRPYDPATWPRPSAEQWGRFSEFLFAQVRELLTDYGKIDLMWFDGGWERSADQWRAGELAAMIRELQPGIIINDRLPGAGDYATPEQFIPATPPAERWEACMTMNESWGYNPRDTRWKSARAIIHTLCEVAGRGGNLLLNVGPTGDGTLQPEAIERLDAVGAWMARNGESITGTQPGFEAWQCYAPSTRRGDRYYVHLLLRPYDTVTVRGIRIKRLRSARVLSSGEELRFRTRCAILDAQFNPDPIGEATITVPQTAIDSHATVLALDFAEAPGA